MKVEELIVRVVGGAVLGAMLGLILSVMPAGTTRVSHLVLGILIVTILITSLLGTRYTVRLVVAGAVILAPLFYFSPGIVSRVSQEAIYYITYLGNVIITTTTSSTSTAMLAWGLIGLVISITMGASAIWSEESRNMKRPG